MFYVIFCFLDVDECKNDYDNDCNGGNFECVNIVGFYKCRCFVGFFYSNFFWFCIGRLDKNVFVVLFCKEIVIGGDVMMLLY